MQTQNRSRLAGCHFGFELIRLVPCPSIGVRILALDSLDPFELVGLVGLFPCNLAVGIVACFNNIQTAWIWNDRKSKPIAEEEKETCEKYCLDSVLCRTVVLYCTAAWLYRCLYCNYCIDGIEPGPTASLMVSRLLSFFLDFYSLHLVFVLFFSFAQSTPSPFCFYTLVTKLAVLFSFFPPQTAPF